MSILCSFNINAWDEYFTEHLLLLLIIIHNLNAECDCEPALTEDAHRYVDPPSGYPLTIIKNNEAYDLSEEITTTDN